MASSFANHGEIVFSSALSRTKGKAEAAVARI
jgi:hypothetical protein